MLGGDNMQTYSNKDDLIFEISKRVTFINEFSDVSESDKDVYKIGVNRTPAQMIAYRLDG